MIEVGITMGDGSWHVYAVPVRDQRWEVYLRGTGESTFWLIPTQFESKDEAVAEAVRRLVKHGRNATGGDGLRMSERT